MCELITDANDTARVPVSAGAIDLNKLVEELKDNNADQNVNEQKFNESDQTPNEQQVLEVD